MGTNNLFRRQLFSCLFLVFLVQLSTAQPPIISYTSVLTGLSDPVDIANAGDGSNRVFIVEQNGNIRVWNGVTTSLFANFGSTGENLVTFGGEQGLLSMAFHPNYNGTTNRFFFIYYVNTSGDIAVTRYQTTNGNINTVDYTTATPIITIPHPGFGNHNGGKLNFGPDGYLYFATGDGGGGNDPDNNAQTGTSLLGKMLRLNIDTTTVLYGNYGVPTIPTPNPYVNDPTIDDRIWALGLRNPFRWTFDRLNGNMWIGDVGQGAQEEISFRPAGATGGVNYGWRCFEGYPSTPGVADCTPADYVPPVFDYPNPSGSPSSVVGGFVYRGSEFPNLRGYYVATDVYSGDVFLLWPNGSGGFDSSTQTGLAVSFIVGYGEAEDGTLYAVSQGTNTMYKVVGFGGTTLPARIERFTVNAANGYDRVVWTTLSEVNTHLFHIEYSNDSRSFERVGMKLSKGYINGSSYEFDHTIVTTKDKYYRLAMEDFNGTLQYSDIVHIPGMKESGIRVYPTVTSSRVVTLESLINPLQQVRIANANGSIVYTQQLNNFIGSMPLRLPQLAPGMYIVELFGERISVREKIIVQ